MHSPEYAVVRKLGRKGHAERRPNLGLEEAARSLALQVALQPPLRRAFRLAGSKARGVEHCGQGGSARAHCATRLPPLTTAPHSHSPTGCCCLARPHPPRCRPRRAGSVVPRVAQARRYVWGRRAAAARHAARTCPRVSLLCEPHTSRTAVLQVRSPTRGVDVPEPGVHPTPAVDLYPTRACATTAAAQRSAARGLAARGLGRSPRATLTPRARSRALAALPAALPALC